MRRRGIVSVTEDVTRGDDGVHVPGWEAFASADRSLRAPARVGDAVMRAWAARTAAPPPGRLTGARWTWAAVAAAVTAGVLSAVSAHLAQQARPAAGVRASTRPSTGPAPAIPLVATVPNQPAPPRGRERMSAAYRAVTGSPAPPVAAEGSAVTFVADPPLEGESLQIVRMRVPRQALQAFGLSMGDPDVATIVEVDVVVGEDGLPRDIRRVRPVADAGEP